MPSYSQETKIVQHIDIKVRSLRYIDNNRWIGFDFEIDNNGKTDYFLLIGIDNLIDKNLMYIWLIHKDDIIREEKFYMRTNFKMTNKKKYLLELQKYEVNNKLKGIKEYREKFKSMTNRMI